MMTSMGSKGGAQVRVELSTAFDAKDDPFCPRGVGGAMARDYACAEGFPVFVVTRIENYLFLRIVNSVIEGRKG
jgi:hypothetical protein